MHTAALRRILSNDRLLHSALKPHWLFAYTLGAILVFKVVPTIVADPITTSEISADNRATTEAVQALETASVR
jgi:hypothetical protein